MARGFFPLDEKLGLGRRVHSADLAKQMVWLSGLLPYKQVEEVFERIGHCAVARMSVWRQAEQHGERLRAYLERKQEQVGVERVVLPPPGQDHRQPKGISLDGGMINIRGEGWKEIKVGAIGDIEQRSERDPVTDEEKLQAHCIHVGYAAVLGSPEAFAPALWALAVGKEVPQAADSCVTADGAEWIWNLTADLFPDSAQIVDWYHASEHLATAAHALHPQDAAKAERWLNDRREHLYLGEVAPITDPLDRAGLSDHARYFHTHQRRMQYQEFREQGYPIGSGTAESGIKQFRVRLSGPGMRWTRPAAQRMLAIRGAVLGNEFDALWAVAN